MDKYFEKTTNKYSFEVNEMCIKMFQSIAPLYKEYANIDEFNQIILSELFTELFKTSQSILSLTSDGNAFEADVLVRILSEGTIKYIFMIQDDIKEKSTNIYEYYVVFPEMQKIAEHEQAVEAMEVFSKLGVNKHPFEVSLLTEEELNQLKQKYSRNYISKLNKKWSYKNLLKKLMEKSEAYSVLATTYYSYALSSHFIHYDGEALYMRSASLKSQAVEFNYDLDIAHILRITSNVLALMLMRTSEYIAKYNIYTEELGKTIKEAMELQREIDMVVNQIAENKY